MQRVLVGVLLAFAAVWCLCWFAGGLFGSLRLLWWIWFAVCLVICCGGLDVLVNLVVVWLGLFEFVLFGGLLLFDCWDWCCISLLCLVRLSGCGAVYGGWLMMFVWVFCCLVSCGGIWADVGCWLVVWFQFLGLRAAVDGCCRVCFGCFSV